MLGLMDVVVDVGGGDRGSTSVIGTGSCITQGCKYLKMTVGSYMIWLEGHTDSQVVVFSGF